VKDGGTPTWEKGKILRMEGGRKKKLIVLSHQKSHTHGVKKPKRIRKKRTYSSNHIGHEHAQRRKEGNSPQNHTKGGNRIKTRGRKTARARKYLLRKSTPPADKAQIVYKVPKKKSHQKGGFGGFSKLGGGIQNLREKRHVGQEVKEASPGRLPLCGKYGKKPKKQGLEPRKHEIQRNVVK